MATVGHVGDPEDKKVGSKITVIHVVNEQGTTVKTYFGYKTYINELFCQTQENLKDRYRQGLGSHITWEDSLAQEFGLPASSCRGLHLISINREEVKKIVRNSYCQEAFKDPTSYIELHVTENRHCVKANFRQPSPCGITRVIDLLGVLAEKPKNAGRPPVAGSGGNRLGLPSQPP